MNKAYFKYLCKTNKKVLLVIFIFGFCVCPLITGLSAPNTIYNTANSSVIYSAHYAQFIVYLLMIIGLSYLLPLFNYRFIQYKKSVDTFLSLPIKKATLFKTIFAFSLFELIAPFFVNSLLALIIIFLKGYYIDIPYYFIYIVFISVFAFVLLVINTFITIKCNTSIDTIICMVAYSVLPFAIFGAILSFIERYVVGTYFYDDEILNFISVLFYFMNYGFAILSKALSSQTSNQINYINSIGFGVLSILLYCFTIKSFVKRSGEAAEQITSSKLMYKLIIPAYTVLCFMLVSIENRLSDYFVFLIVVFIVYMIGIFIANREVKITKTSIILFIIFVIFTNVLGYVFKANRAFGLSKNFPEDYKYISVYSSINDNNDNSDVSYIAEKITNKDIFNEIVKVQNNLVDNFYSGITNDDEWYGYIRIVYYDEKNVEIGTYDYNFDKSERGIDLAKLLLENNYEIYKYNYNGVETKATIDDLNLE